MKKVEGTEDQFLRLPPNSLFERLKVRDPTLILNNHLAVDDCGAAVKLARCLCYAEVAFAPIEAIAGIGMGLAALDDKEGAVAIVLDFNESSLHAEEDDRLMSPAAG